MVFHKHWLWIGYEDAESEILSEACNALHELSFLPPPFPSENFISKV
jgi:hypothetical protein